MRIIYLLLVLAMMSCKDQKKEEATVDVSEEVSKMAEAREIHDVLMKDLKTMVNLKMELELAGKDTIPELKERHARVKAANDEMFAWMGEFGQKFTSEEIFEEVPLAEEKKPLLEEYHGRIVKLQEEFEAILSETDQ